MDSISTDSIVMVPSRAGGFPGVQGSQIRGPRGACGAIDVPAGLDCAEPGLGNGVRMRQQSTSGHSPPKTAASRSEPVSAKWRRGTAFWRRHV
jgi:hypothetical protein